MIGAIAMGFASSMVNVAVPAVMGAYGVGLDQAQWMATGFLATMSTTMLLSSWLIEVLGQRVTYFLTMTVFAIGSLISAYKRSYGKNRHREKIGDPLTQNLYEPRAKQHRC